MWRLYNVQETSYSGVLEQWLKDNGDKLIDYLPAETGIYRIATVNESLYRSSFVSLAGGGYKPPGEAGNWYGSNWDTCFAETRPSGDCVLKS
jgi:hypothetical protein